MGLYEKIALYLCLALVIVSIFRGCNKEESVSSKALTEIFLNENKKLQDSLAKIRNKQDSLNIIKLREYIDSKNVQPIINKFITIYDKINTESDSGQLILVNELVASHKATPVVRN